MASVKSRCRRGSSGVRRIDYSVFTVIIQVAITSRILRLLDPPVVRRPRTFAGQEIVHGVRMKGLINRVRFGSIPANGYSVIQGTGELVIGCVGAETVRRRSGRIESLSIGRSCGLLGRCLGSVTGKINLSYRCHQRLGKPQLSRGLLLVPLNLVYRRILFQLMANKFHRNFALHCHPLEHGRTRPGTGGARSLPAGDTWHISLIDPRSCWR